ncbi:hypothetical protein [Ruficoccus sp. ZRK36]|uniref:hypothetical protein n=1 Tax=Ruficoccus sp. ZRK36 TaxID=2866311 RepID=UPI001C739346|nr:hypothetical protein [Ruficoccus sp. ZRK36]QYY34587.1 hypothetical protein K0V07_09755 [Ruficoccus sp. ZRK36]
MPLCTRKPSTWAECPRHRHDELSPLQRDLIRTLPVKGTDAASPMDEFLEENPPLECVVLITGGHVFYVNTEGYRYARYAFHILA